MRLAANRVTSPDGARALRVGGVACLILGLLAGGYAARDIVAGGNAAGGRHAVPAPERTAATTVAASVPAGQFEVTPQQMRGLTLAPVRDHAFQPTRTADGTIAINENQATPVFSPFSGARVLRLHADVGDVVAAGAPLLEVESPDVVQAGNDLTAAAGALDKARSQQRLAETVEARQRELYGLKAVALKDWQQAQADLAAARSDAASADAALAAARNRLALLGKSAPDIAQLQAAHRIDPTAVITAPIGGIVVRRKVAPGQYLSASASNPLYQIGNLSTVWLVASVKETDVPYIHVGQRETVRVLAFPDRTFAARIVSVGSTIDPDTRRLAVRAEVENPDQMLKPGMFASFAIAVGGAVEAPAVPLDAVVLEGDQAHVWVAVGERRFASRAVRLGVDDGTLAQVVGGLRTGEQVVTQGSLFVDRGARPE